MRAHLHTIFANLQQGSLTVESSVIEWTLAGWLLEYGPAQLTSGSL